MDGREESKETIWRYLVVVFSIYIIHISLGISYCCYKLLLETEVTILLLLILITCYHQPCSCLCEVDPGWMVEGQATKEVEPRLPRLPNGWLSRQSRQSSLYVIQVQDNNG